MIIAYNYFFDFAKLAFPNGRRRWEIFVATECGSGAISTGNPNFDPDLAKFNEVCPKLVESIRRVTLVLIARE